MTILVAYASKHGATRQIAERIGETLRAAGRDAEVRAIEAAGDPAGYDAFVIGSAVYFGAWRKEATAFARRHRAVLAARPVWLFSSGPLGTETTDARGRDQREAAVPEEIAELTAAITPRGHRVFFGALDRSRIGPLERLLRALPAGRALLPEGDFRDWADVEPWAAGIAQALAPVPAGGR
jgi:menaquinone-dependent protoporphyrinogen oxidase